MAGEILQFPSRPDELVQWRGFRWPDLWSLLDFVVSGLISGLWSVFPDATTAVAYATLTGYPAKGVRVPAGPS